MIFIENENTENERKRVQKVKHLVCVPVLRATAVIGLGNFRLSSPLHPIQCWEKKLQSKGGRARFSEHFPVQHCFGVCGGDLHVGYLADCPILGWWVGPDRSEFI